MYGGLMFSEGSQFCGVFAYKGHVSVEFGLWLDIQAPHGVLEGCGKMRRLIRLFTSTDIMAKYLERYLYAFFSNSYSHCR
ncbi:MAG: hypothetical protein JZU65_07150 [Chlorobium sp.]|jgi:hypothetical protein|nr:hypothetical protein [Chlorobium sp.]